MAENNTTCLDYVGKTPIVRLRRIHDHGAAVFVKLDMLNPTGSIKDVMAAYMVEMACSRGELRPGGTILEATSGNTGISFAMIAAISGYRFIATMPEHMSVERVRMMEAFGAEVVLTPAELDMAGAIEKRQQLLEEIPDAWCPDQFSNPDNTEAHCRITGAEILRQITGRIDAFVAGVGTGGTLLGVARALRAANPMVRIVAVEPVESPALTKGGPCALHGIQGIGEGFVPGLVDLSSIDAIELVSTEEAVEMSRRLALEEGLFAGVSSGANVVAALREAGRLGRGATVVTVLPDRGERYLSLSSPTTRPRG